MNEYQITITILMFLVWLSAFILGYIIGKDTQKQGSEKE